MRRLFARISGLAKKAWHFIWRRKSVDVAVFTGTLTFTYWVMNKLLPSWLVVASLVVLVVHEMAHYIAAKRAGVDVHLPFFVPMIYGFFGSTWVQEKQVDHESGQKIALAGPGAGLVACLAVMAGCGYVGFMPGVYAGGWMLLSQVFSGTFGSDGRKYRRRRHEAAIMAGAAA